MFQWSGGFFLTREQSPLLEKINSYRFTDQDVVWQLILFALWQSGAGCMVYLTSYMTNLFT